MTLVGVVGFSFSMRAQNTSNPGVAKPVVDPVVHQNVRDWIIQGRGLPDDWSHHHLHFSDPGTEEDAFRKGAHEHWLKIVNDPRFIMEQIKRGKGTAALEGADVSAASTPRAEDSFSSAAFGRGPWTVAPPLLKKDWSVNMGGASAAQITAEVNSNNATGGSTVVVNGASTVTLTANTPTAEQEDINFGSTEPANGAYVTLGPTGSTMQYTFTTSNVPSTVSSGCTVYSGSGSSGATNLYDAITLSGSAGVHSYMCASGVTANSAISTTNSSVSGSEIKLFAEILGSTGFSFSTTGTTNFTLSNTPGTNGTPSGTAFNYWSGNAAVSASQLATSIATAMAANSTLTGAFTITSNTTATPPMITLTDKTTGTAGNSYTATSSFSGYVWGNGGTFGGGTASASVGAGQYPAKFTFYPIGTPACASAADPDYVVYSTSEFGTATQASLVAYDNLYSGYCTTGTVPSAYWAYNTGGTILTSPVLSLDGTQVAFVQNSTLGAATLALLKWKATPATSTVSASVTSGSMNFTVSSGTISQADVGAQVSLGTDIPAGDTIVSVTSSTAGTLATAATTTGSGTMTITGETYSTPGVPPTVAASSYSACTAPCMTLLPFDQTVIATDSFSSPYVDYATGTLYVGDDNGYLHKFTNVFTSTGTPGETEGSGWPIEANTLGKALTGPVYDSSAYDGTTVTPQVFVADAGGFLYGFSASTGAVVGLSSQLGTGKGIVDAPLVDSSVNTVYAFVGDDLNTTNNKWNCNSTTGCEGIFRFSVASGATATAGGLVGAGTATCTLTSTTSNATWTTGSVCGVESVLGIGETTTSLYDGAFDNTYFTGTGTTGNIWACPLIGATGAKLDSSPLSGFTATGAIQFRATDVVKPLTSANPAGCSPVTEIYNTTTSTDWIFLSVTTNGTQGVCSGACLYNFNLNSAPTAATAGIATTGGSSGIIIDNVASTTTYPGASQIYYSPLGSTTSCGTGGAGGCAVQAAQSAP
jgi:hypothetical protein